MRKTIKIIKLNWHLSLLIGIWVFFISPVFLSSRTPFPSTYQVNFFSPWSSYPGMGGPVKNNAQPDIIGQIYPWRHLSIEELKAGRLPLWNPYSFAGTPHLANYQSAPLFPLNILFFLPVKFIDAWSTLVLLQPLLAGIFTVLLSRALKISRVGSFISGISFMFCGFLVTWLGYATLGYAILPLPLAIFAVIKHVESKKMRWLILISSTFPLSFFAGHFQTSLYFFLAVTGYIFYNLLLSKDRKSYFYPLIFIGAGLLLIMPQVLPSLELYSMSFRSELFQKFEAIPLQYLVTLFSPDFYGNPVTRNDWFGHYAEWNGYAGIIPLLLAVFAAIFGRNKAKGFYIILAAVSLLLALDTPVLSLVVAMKIPVISTSAASRIIVLFSFSIAILAGFGFDQLSQKIKERKKIYLWATIALLLFISLTLIGMLGIKEGEKIAIAQKNSILPAVILSSLVGGSILITIVRQKWAFHLLAAVVLIVCSFEMYRFAAKWQNFDPKRLAHIDVPVADFYRAQNDYDRAVGMSGGEDAVYYRVPVLSGYDPLYKGEYGEFMRFVGAGRILNPERSVVNFPYKGVYTPEALNFLGVHFVVHKVSDGNFPWAFPFDDYPLPQFTKIYDDSHYHVYRNNAAFDRAFIVGDVRMLPKKRIPSFLFDNDLKKVAAVEDEIERLDVQASGSAKITSYLPLKITIEAESSGKALLVLTDNYYPGWGVKVNGVNQKIYKANYSFRGVIIPSGKSIVEFKYTPNSFLIGIYLFMLGLMVIIMVKVLQVIKTRT